MNATARAEVHKALYDTNYKSEVKLRDVTPAILLGQKGVKNLPMTMVPSHIRQNVFTVQEALQYGLPVNSKTHYHGLGEDFFLQIIDSLDDVEEAYRGTQYAEKAERRENYFLLITKIKVSNNEIINVPIYINDHGVVNNVFIDVNKISTVFGRNDLREYINRQVKKQKSCTNKKQKC